MSMKFEQFIKKISQPLGFETSIGLVFVHNRTEFEELREEDIEELDDLEVVRKYCEYFLSWKSSSSKSDFQALSDSELGSLTDDDLESAAKALLSKVYFINGTNDSENLIDAFPCAAMLKEEALKRARRPRKLTIENAQIKNYSGMPSQESLSRINEIGSSYASMQGRINQLQSMMHKKSPLMSGQEDIADRLRIPKPRSETILEELVDLTSETVRQLESSNSVQQDMVIKLDELYNQHDKSDKRAGKLSIFNIVTTVLIIVLTALGLYFSYQN